MRHLGVELDNETFPQTDICSVMFTQSELSGLLRVDRIVLVSDVADLRAGMDTLRTKAIQTFGQVAPHEAYVFMNRSQSLLKLVVHDAMGSWLCTRRLHEGRFYGAGSQIHPQLTADQFLALTWGLPWQRLGEASIFRYS